MIGQEHSVRPEAIRLEASSACQLRCPTCPTTKGQTHKFIGTGVLKSKDFVRLLDNGQGSIRYVELANYGEAFLNPEMIEIMRIADERGVGVSCHSGANLNTVRDEVLEAIVKYRMRDITCSIDGASDETYRIYRRRGNFTKVIENIRKINEYKRTYNSPYPNLVWQFVIFGHNEHEIAKARALAEELDMTFLPKLSWEDGFSPIKNPEEVLQASGLGATTTDEYNRETKSIYMGSICRQLWDAPQINYDGRVLGCCTNFWADFGGNAFEDYDGAINSENIRYARAMLMGQVAPREDIPCATCHIFKTRLKTGDWLPAA